MATMEERKDETDGVDDYVDAWVGMVSHEVKRVCRSIGHRKR